MTGTIPLALRRGGEADIPFIMATERGPGFDRVVGRWEEALHRAEMGLAGSAYYIGEREGRPLGFVLFQHGDDPAGDVLLRRIAVGEPGRGAGRALLEAALPEAFERFGARRIHLTVAPFNERGRHLYAAFGFRAVGAGPQVRFRPEDEPFFLIRMTVERAEWQAIAPTGAGSIR